MKLNFNEIVKSQDINIDSLRPNKSYDHLIEHRNSILTDVLKDKDLLSNFLKVRSCPCCNSDNFKQLANKDNLDIVQCDDCDVIYVNPLFESSKYIELYKSSDYQQIVKNIGESSHDYRRSRFGVERVNFISKNHDASLPKTFLDIGCSTGFTIQEAAHQGWDSHGIELNPSAAKFGQELGLNITCKAIEDCTFDKKYSSIGLFDVLEHLTDPLKMLLHCRELLNTGGNLFIYVPNWNSATRYILGIPNSHFIWPSHHLTYFTPVTLKAFLEKNGFEVFFFETQGLDFYDIKWYFEQNNSCDTHFIEQYIDCLQFFANSSGHGKNLRMFCKKV